MESIIYEKPIVHGVVTLKALIANFKEYTKEVKYSDDPHTQYEECVTAIDLIKGSIDQITMARSKLQELIDKMKSDYDNTKNREDKKTILTAMESIENASKFTEAMNEATELSLMLTTRLTETRSKEKRLARKLGLSGYRQSTQEDESKYILDNGANDSHHNQEFQPSHESNPRTLINVPLPQISLPKFYGTDEEFPEFWAAFRTLVHENRALSNIEKMLLLKDSLKGTSDKTIKGIQLIPQNYEWMIQLLTKKYGNKPTSRARIVRQLHGLQKADRSAESNEAVFDQICMLLNQMTSAGQDIRHTNDAMWIEAILDKFPREIIGPVLAKLREKEETTVESIMEMIEAEISTKAYVQARLNLTPILKVDSKYKSSNQPQVCAICDKVGHNTWQCKSPVTIADRRKIMLQKRLCWKCYSSHHSSNQCTRSNCPLCGGLHHSKLCYAGEKKNERNDQHIHARQNFPQPNAGNRQTEHNSNQYVPSKRSNDSDNKQVYRPGATKSQSRNTTIQFQTKNADNRTQIDESFEITQREREEMHTNMEDVSSDKDSEQIALMTAKGPIWNYNTGKFENVIFFFDTGAQRTIIQEQLAIKLGLPTLKTETCVMSGIGGHTETFDTSVVHLRIGTAYGKDLEILVQTKPILTNGFPAVKLSVLDLQYLQERNIRLSNPNTRGETQTPQILVGLDYYYNFVLDDGDTHKIPSGLRMANTVFGPTIYGRGTADLSEPFTPTQTTISHNLTVIAESEKELLKKLFELEGMGITSEDNQEESDFFTYFKEYSKHISFKDGYLTAPFPLKPSVQDLADNYSSAIRRLISLHKQLEANPTQKKWYCKILRQYQDEDIIEPVTGEVPDSVGRYYMPHSGVWRPDKPRPLRVVFDASSKRKGQLSLNDVTLKGEALVNKIHDILIASRIKKIIMTCDIEAAFTQIRLQDNHKDLCRFLWFRNPNMPPTRDNIMEYRFKRIPFGAKPSPSILNMCLLTFLKSKNTSLSQEIIDNLYVDNVLLTAESPPEAITKYQDSKTLFAEIGMNLREYVSNCDEVNISIPKQDRAPTGIIKLLGVEYNTNSDRFSLTLKFNKKATLTKKDIVSQLNSVYDPIGIACPLTIRLKHLMREIYNSGIGWKDTVPIQLAKEWARTCQELDNITLSLPRPAFSERRNKATALWVFADASIKAIAACAYFRHENPTLVTPLVSGKTRLTPKKNRQTIPRLETLAILMAIRLARNISTVCQKQLKEVNILSDSEIALNWMKSTRNLPLFVENQKRRILQEISIIEQRGMLVQFYYVPTEKNPADAGTRGVDISQLQELPWIYGPQWLSEESLSFHLKPMAEISQPHLLNDEMIPEEYESEFHMVAETKKPSTSWLLLERFSRWTTAVRTVALVGKVIHRWVDKTNSKKMGKCIQLTHLNKFNPNRDITVDDLSFSETLIFKESHKEVSVEQLRRRYPQKKIFRDVHGIIRNQSRLQNAAIMYDTRNPIYVDKGSDLARLLLIDIHVKNAHCGKDHTLCIARQRFWIPRPSGAYKQFLKQCVICKRYQGLPFGAPEMPPLPNDRITQTKPFQNVGCDFMGPYLCKDNEKYYICLYTCLTTRAIHLEVVEDMSAKTFLSSFIRFISRRGVPRLIRTDCGANFKLGQHVIDLLHDSTSNNESILTYSTNRGIRWIFNPPNAPWMGGAWERMVGSVKRAFAKSVGRRKLAYSELYTAVTEIEAIINTRPLTSCSSNVDELPIRPIDFLQPGLRYAIQITGDNQQDPSFDPYILQSAAQVKQALEYAERVVERFWERWHIEYLTELREIQTMNRKQSRHIKWREPRIGEIVLVEQDDIPRGSWCYGKIQEVIKSSDGLSRSVKLLMPNKRIWHRPVTKIYPLEISSLPENNTTPAQFEEQKTSNIEQESAVTTRPAREAKRKALKAIKTTFKHHSDESASHIYQQNDQPPHLHTPIRNHSILQMITLMTALLIHRTDAAAKIVCENTTLRVIPPNTTFELCIRDLCRFFMQVTDVLTFDLPSSTYGVKIPIVIKYTSNATIEKDEASCVLPKICDTSQSLLSKRLIGNPHCWPTGAFISIALAAYVALFFCLLIAKFMRQKRSHRNCSKLVSHTDEFKNSAVTPPYEETERITLHTFTPVRLTQSMTTVAVVILTSAVIASSCQYGYSRHSANMICSSTSNCSLHFYREVMFNEVTHVACISILHNNKTVGTIRLERSAVELTCSKRSLYFTRDTEHKTFSATRCAFFGSCINDTCSKITHESRIEELTNASQYPGHSGCEYSCGGLFCGCPLPLPSCSFYRIVNIPRSKVVYEIVRCMAWKPTVQLSIRLTLLNTITQKTLAMKPYVKKDMEGMSFTVISLTAPMNPLLSSRFAVAVNETLIVPEDTIIPVECPTYRTAAANFAHCRNKLSCNCEVEVSPVRCYCPNDSLHTIRTDKSNILPVSTPFLRVEKRNNEITAISKREEMTIAVESVSIRESTALFLEQDCSISVHRMIGCYRCLEGARLNVSCQTKIQTWLVVQCGSITFSIECSPNNKSTTVRLDFSQAVINEKCHTQCNGRSVEIPVQGTLEFQIHYSDEQIFDSHKSPWKRKLDWVHNWHFPDLGPILIEAQQHWKAAVAVMGSFTIIAVATYMTSPCLLAIMVQVSQVMILLTKLTYTIAYKMLTFVIETIRYFLQTSSNKDSTRSN